MYKNRIIPCLLRHNKGFVKTVNFKNPVYLGDPFNITRLFNEKEVDEMIILDIDASAQNKNPDYQFIEDIASECFMPLCYGGGVKTIDQMRHIFSLGIEKIALGSVLIENPEIIKTASNIFGAQSLVAVLDVKKTLFGNYQVCTHNAKINTKLNPVELAKQYANLGIGEILINNIDNDGKMQGYDLKLIKSITEQVPIPVIALGGAGSQEHLKSAILDANASAAAAGSMFVFSGKHRAVLVNYAN